MKETYEDRKPARQTQPAAQIEIVTECKKQRVKFTHTARHRQTVKIKERERERERGMIYF